MSSIKDGSYINIQSFMVTELELKGNELLVYAIIYGFSQTNGTYFTGSTQYLADWTNSTRQGIMKNLKSLMDKGLIEKIGENNQINCYKALRPVNKVNQSTEFTCKQSLQGDKQSLQEMVTKFTGTCKQSLHNNIDNILDNNINTTTNLDKENKIDQNSKDSSSESSSFSNNSSSKEKDTIFQIKSALQNHGLSVETSKNIMELVKNGQVNLERIKSVLAVAPIKKWREGAIYKALKENWDTREIKADNPVTEKEVRIFLEKRTKHWIEAYKSIGDYKYSSTRLIAEISKYAGDFPELVDEYYNSFESTIEDIRAKKGA